MGENLIPKLAEWLGLVDGDEFDVEGGVYNPYKYENGRFNDCEGDRMRDAYLAGMLDGDIEVKKLPWKPKFGEVYWYVHTGEPVMYTSFTCGADVARYLMGNCFRTLDEAKANKPEILAKIREVLE